MFVFLLFVHYQHLCTAIFHLHGDPFHQKQKNAFFCKKKSNFQKKKKKGFKKSKP